MRVAKRVLVVEDNELNLKLFCDLLRAHGFAVEPVRDGREAVARELKARYALAAFFSAGVLMPIGYEWGYAQPLHVVETTPESRENETGIDVSGYIAAINRLRADLPAANVEGAQWRLSAPDAPYVALIRIDTGHPGSAENGAVYNHAAAFYVHALYDIGDADRAYSALRRMIPGPDEADLRQRGQLPVFIPNYYRGAHQQFPRTAGRSSQLFNTGTAAWACWNDEFNWFGWLPRCKCSRCASNTKYQCGRKYCPF